jgi:hypothetical protein
MNKILKNKFDKRSLRLDIEKHKNKVLKMERHPAFMG